MPLEDPTAIDIIITSDDQKPILVVTDSGATTDPARRYELFMEKLQTYVFAIVEGALSDQFPDASPNDYRIRLICANPPTEEMLAINGLRPREHGDLFIPVEFEQWSGETGATPQPIVRASAPPPQISEELSCFADLCIEAGLKAAQQKDSAAHVAWMEAGEFKTAVLGHFAELPQMQMAAAGFTTQLTVAPALFATISDGIIGTENGTKTDAILVHAYQSEIGQGIVFGQAYQPKRLLKKFGTNGSRLILDIIGEKH